MASIDDELLLDAEYDAKAVAFIKARLPQELQEKIDEELLYYFLDVIVEFYTESGILDAEPDEEGFINIDLEDIANHMVKKAQKEGMGEYTMEEMLMVAQAEAEFEESMEED